MKATEFILLLLFLLLQVFSTVNAADVGLRFHYDHEVRDLLAQPVASYPECHQRISVVQFPVEQQVGRAGEVRKCFPKSRITEEMILVNVAPDATEEKDFDLLIKRIAAGEAAGFEWGDLIVYREPLFAALCPDQNLMPGPWKDRRLVSERDVNMLRARLRRAHAAGQIAHANYRVCGLLYSWLNIDEQEKAFIGANLDGVYVELNSRGGKWQVEGVRTSIGEEFKNPGHDFPAFGLPGTRDTAQMAAWCLAGQKRFGITSGANIPDRWYRTMFEDFLMRTREVGINPAHPLITYLLHHNRSADDQGLPFFPESGSETMTALAKMVLDAVGSARD